jgi:hypothetical protein
MIYEHAFSNALVRVHVADPYTPRKPTTSPQYRSTFGLLLTCHQIRNEARASFHALCTLDLGGNHMRAIGDALGLATCKAVHKLRILCDYYHSSLSFLCALLSEEDFRRMFPSLTRLTAHVMQSHIFVLLGVEELQLEDFDGIECWSLRETIYSSLRF